MKIGIDIDGVLTDIEQSKKYLMWTKKQNTNKISKHL